LTLLKIYKSLTLNLMSQNKIRQRFSNRRSKIKSQIWEAKDV